MIIATLAKRRENKLHSKNPKKFYLFVYLFFEKHVRQDFNETILKNQNILFKIRQNSQFFYTNVLTELKINLKCDNSSAMFRLRKLCKTILDGIFRGQNYFQNRKEQMICVKTD